jgi:hypothetical protein
MIDTTSLHGKLILSVLAALVILARTAEGRKRAMTGSVRFGRKPKLTPFQAQEAIARIVQLRIAADVGIAVMRMPLAVSH